MTEIKLSFGTTAPSRAHTVATAYGVPTQPTEDGLGQGWVYLFTNQDLLDVTNAQQLELVETIVERFNCYNAVRNQMTEQVSERDAILRRLIKWDTDFPVNGNNGYAGLKELNVNIADAKAAVGDDEL